jgi:UDP-glucose 4-epimerase
MRIAVIGGAGFAGVHLVSALLACGHDVHVYDNLFAGRRRQDLPWLQQVQFAEADIVDGQRLRQEMTAFHPDLVYHLAALHYIPYCDRHPGDTMRVNVEGTLNVMLAASSVSTVQAVLYASSVAVYRPTDDYHAESDQPGPCDIYGLTKFLGEQVVEQYARLARISHLSLRFANIYGPHETNPHVIPTVLDQLLDGAATLHLGRTDPCRDFIYVGDLVDALLAAIPVVIREETHDVLNLGPGREWPVQEAIDILCQLSGRTIRTVREDGLVRPVDRMHLRATIERARELLAWDPKHDLRRGLELTFDLECRKRKPQAAAAHR